jgi:2-dehydro-3-deoxygalactonokinase
MKLLVIDSGTTNSRVRLMDGHEVVGSVSRNIGSKDVAITGNTEVLECALKEAVLEVIHNNQIRLEDIEAIIASGMITSNMGLLEVPHLPAPVNVGDVAAGMISRTFPAIVDKPILFIPGVKTGFIGEAELVQKDMMRGEEAEIFGYLEYLGEAAIDPLLFMHYGSHHKGILLEGGEIKRCATSMTGELMMAILQNTILKSSLVAPAEMQPRLEDVRIGLAIAESAGFGRALFSSRVMHVMEQRDKQEVTGLFLGALLSLDLAMLNDLLTPDTRKIVLYGKALFPSLCAPILQERYPNLGVTVISESQSNELSAKGATSLYRKYVEGLKS